ncbi:protein KRI1 homolog isoform X2 [Rhopilema esculentum]|uniref:protein KRI1 homolog isoform X2 n=1 Tax=Rhopilema esculentum TaxID=499914 RepID=UPI0031DE4EAC
MADKKARCRERMGTLKINKSYAKQYNKRKEKQELDQLKQKYGSDNFEEESSTSESEDEEAVAITPQIERDFIKTLALIKSRDPKIYDKSTSFFEEGENSETAEADVEKKKPVYLKDHERNRILSRGVKAFVSDSESESDTNEDQDKIISKEDYFLSKEDDLTYVKEQQKLKESFKTALDNVSDNEEFLTVKRSESPSKKQDLSFNQTESFPVDDDEKFLTSYLLKREYCEDDDSAPHFSAPIEEEDDSELDREEAFERKYNFRYEEPDEDFIKMYPRTIKESVRRKDDSRKKKRDVRNERKKKEKEVREEEIRKLKKLKRKEILEKIDKIKEITGNSKVGFLEDNLDGDFDPKEYDMLMQRIYDTEFYEADEKEKPTFEDDSNYYEDWDDWQGENQEETGPDEQVKGEAYYEDANSVTSQSKFAKESQLAKKLTQKKPVFDPGEKTFEEYFDEYYKLEYEDIIGDLPVRFKYREVMPNNYGLSTNEILNAEDKELNQWCSLGRTSKYLSTEEEIKDRYKYKRKARSSKRKARVFSSLFTSNSEDLNTAKSEGKDKSKKLKISQSLKDIPSEEKKSSLINRKLGGKGKNRIGKGTQKVGKRLEKLSSKRFAAYGFGKRKRKRS